MGNLLEYNVKKWQKILTVVSAAIFRLYKCFRDLWIIGGSARAIKKFRTWVLRNAIQAEKISHLSNSNRSSSFSQFLFRNLKKAFVGIPSTLNISKIICSSSIWAQNADIWHFTRYSNCLQITLKYSRTALTARFTLIFSTKRIISAKTAFRRQKRFFKMKQKRQNNQLVRVRKFYNSSIF